MRRFFSALSFVLLCIFPAARAAEIHVPRDFPSIQGAIDAASDGDTIWVHPGTYEENIDFKGKKIALRSTEGCGSTIIDGNRQGPVVTFQNDETWDAVIDGFTITNGYNPTGEGGGIFIYPWAYPTITNNHITRNEAKWGGGIVADYSDVIIDGNVIDNNVATFSAGGGYITPFNLAFVRNNIISNNKSTGLGPGGLLILGFSGAEVVNNVITRNHSPIHEGGISWYTDSYKNGFIVGNLIAENTANTHAGGLGAGRTPLIKNNYILDNQAGDGGGGLMLMPAKENPCYIQNNVICGNTAHSGGGVVFQPGLFYFVNNTVWGNVADGKGGGLCIDFFSKVVVRNSIIWGNRAGMGDDEISWLTYPDIRYSDIRGGWPGAGNIDADPMFVDPENGDFHLQYGSPCIDAGTKRVPGGLPDADMEGDARIVGAGVDMGADEFGTHLYFMGVPAPGSLVTLKIIGNPGATPVGLFISEAVLDPPIFSPFGAWYLQFPVYGPILLGPVPSNGVILFYGILPPDLPGPYTLDFQALVQDELTNLSVLDVE